MRHGGNLNAIKKRYGAFSGNWLDLSTGVSPFPYDDSSVVLSTLTALPSEDGELEKVAANYYGVESILMTPGSMWSIKQLPNVLSATALNANKTALLPKEGFSEHKIAWLQNGFDIEEYHVQPSYEQMARASVCIIINPNNPTGHLITEADIKGLIKTSKEQGVFLIVDEAFMDAQPECSIAYQVKGAWPEHLIVLKSFGKFFGLPGLRLAGLIANDAILAKAKTILGPWGVSSLAQALGISAYQNHQWQAEQRQKLQQKSRQLHDLLSRYFPASNVFKNDLFITCKFEGSLALYESLLQNGIYTRLLDDDSGIRFGLPHTQSGLERLHQALKEYNEINDKVVS